MPLQQSPEGLFKRVEIGINNYDPTLFMNQSFTIFFFRESSNAATAEESKNDANRTRAGILSQMPQDEYMTLMQRIDNDLVAFGEFQANEIVSNSVCQDDFIDVEPRLTQSDAG